MARTVSRVTVAAAAGAVAWMVFAGCAAGAQRVALVIGNASYAHVPSLANPLHDAADVGAALERLGFSVTRLDNAGYAELRRGLLAFQRAASASDIAMVFYAGHGIEVDQRNFLVPVDARLASDQDVEFEAVPLELASRAVDRASGLRLVILDACRENPFVVSMQRSGATRSIGRGLARVEPSGETLVAYAAKEGTVAADGSGRNSPYSKALLRHLEEPGLEVGLMFRKVRDAVLAATGGRQEPFVYGSLSSSGVYLSAAPASVPTPAAVTAPSAESPVAAAPPLANEELAARAYEAAERIHTVGAYELVIGRFPGSIYADLARTQVEKLTESGVLPAGDDVASAAASSGGASVETSLPPKTLPAPSESELALGLTREARRLVQYGLSSLGFSPGPADGVFGPRTRSAIRAYRERKGLSGAEYLTAELSQALQELGVDARREERRRAELAREEASRAADDAAFARAKELDTRVGYEGYLARGGRHASEARRRLAALPKPKASGEVFRDCAGCPELVVIPSGSFMMGSPRHEEGRDDDEGPRHRVAIGEPFAMGVYEVTFAEWDACRGEGGCSHRPDDEGWGRGNRPMVDVSWEDAKAYVRWLARKTGEGYRLLSESEWEYAARGGSTTRYWWGDAVGRGRANCAGCGSRWDGARTAPVGSFSPNSYGLHDVHGNVWEWVEDCWHASYAGAPQDGRAWTTGGGGECGKRVLRGGSWNFLPRHARSADRIRSFTEDRLHDVGFRVARTLD